MRGQRGAPQLSRHSSLSAHSQTERCTWTNVAVGQPCSWEQELRGFISWIPCGHALTACCCRGSDHLFLAADIKAHPSRWQHRRLTGPLTVHEQTEHFIMMCSLQTRGWSVQEPVSNPALFCVMCRFSPVCAKWAGARGWGWSSSHTLTYCFITLHPARCQPWH